MAAEESSQRSLQHSSLQTERLLVVGPAWIGDMVLAQSLYKSLSRINPEIEIDVLAPAWSRALLKRMPEVSDFVELDADHGELKLGLRYKLGRRLRQRAYTQAIVLPRSFKSALVPWFAGIPKRTGYRGEMRYGVINDMRVLDKILLPRTVDRFVALGQASRLSSLTLPDHTRRQFEIPTPKLEVDANQCEATLRRLELNAPRQMLALAPGAAYGKSKQWPVAHFAEVARHFLGQNWAVWIFGSAQDRAASREIIAQSGGNVVDLCGKTTLEEAIDLLSLADLVISNDSGLMHVAAAVDSKLVAVYGSSTPAYTPPLSAGARTVYHGIQCSPCWARECRYGHYRCLTGIAAAEVIRHAETLLSEA